jgi:hypothetical protein
VTGREQEDHDARLDAGRSPDTSPGQSESEAPATTRAVPDDQWVAYAASVAHDYSAAHQRAESLEAQLAAVRAVLEVRVPYDLPEALEILAEIRALVSPKKGDQ